MNTFDMLKSIVIVPSANGGYVITYYAPKSSYAMSSTTLTASNFEEMSEIVKKAAEEIRASS